MALGVEAEEGWCSAERKMSVCVELLCLRLRPLRAWTSEAGARPLGFSDASRRLSKMFWLDAVWVKNCGENV